MARALRSSNRRCFLSRRTWKRSKSVRAFLRSIWSRFLAQLVCSHLESISDFSQSFRTTPVREPRFRPSTTREERRTLLRGTACRGVARLAFAEGPSTRICGEGQYRVSLQSKQETPTRLWSMISTIVARWPAKGWSPLITTTRPTSTRRQFEPSMTASPIVTVIYVVVD